MKPIFFIAALLCLTTADLQAQDNVADIAHAFMKAVKYNALEHIKPKFLDANSAYALLPKESAGMNVKQKNETYIKPLHSRFTENFEKIQSQIRSGNIDPKKIDLISYKIEKIDPNAPEAKGKKILPQAMSLFFNYKKKEHVLPVSVVQIDEKWYIVEILHTSNLFE